MKKQTFLTVVLVGILQISCTAQLFIDSTYYSAATMVQDFFGSSPCAAPYNVVFHGQNVALGYFDASQTTLGLNAGILLTTGLKTNAVGPNNRDGAGTILYPADNGGLLGDADLATLANTANIKNAAIMEFDFIALEDSIRFKYVFASEEYPEYTCSGFNDVFGFFVSGPGIVGTKNIATLPNNNNAYVSVDNVNNGGTNFGSACPSPGVNPQYYVRNSPPNAPVNVQYDGMTVPLIAKTAVQIGQVYHAKVAIGDVGDADFDSAIFMSVESLCGVPFAPVVAACNATNNSGNTVAFSNASRYATSFTWDFGDGSPISTARTPTHTFTDLATNGYDVRLTAANYCCSDTKIIRVGSLVGTTAPRAARPYRMFPNPAKDRVNIEMPIGEAAEVSLINPTGQIIAQQKISGNATLFIPNTETNQLLFVRVSTAKGVFVDKLVVQ